jgi:hypothetical protein
MKNQTGNLRAEASTESASIPNLLSRILLAAEVIVIIFPLLALASILTFFFVIFWLPIAIGSSIFDPGIEKSLIIVIIGLSAVASISYLANVTQLSVRYVFKGRSSLQKVSRIEWLILCTGVIITIGWAIIACLNFGSKSDTTLSANSIFFIPGLLLILPTFHLFLAQKIAEYRLR